MPTMVVVVVVMVVVMGVAVALAVARRCDPGSSDPVLAATVTGRMGKLPICLRPSHD